MIIVGNGTSLLNASNGSKIDAFKNVVRFNAFAIKGYENFVGTKTTHLYYVNHSYEKRAEEIKNVYVHSWDRESKCPVYKAHKHLDNVQKVPFDFVQGVIKKIKGVIPSTGLIAIYHQLQWHDELTLTGFDWWDTEKHHYFGPKDFRGPNHKPSVEKELITGLIKKNKLKFL